MSQHCSGLTYSNERLTALAMPMLSDPSVKYRPFSLGVDMSDRTWPSKAVARAPRWLSTDLRDGNQALADPMDVEKKMTFFNMLLKVLSLIHI